MNSYFDRPDRLAKLQAVAESWLGTPFMPNAAVKGAGVCCQKLAGAIYIEAGFLPAGFEIPSGPMNWSHANTRSLIAEFMDARPEFAAVAQTSTSAGSGDLLGFKIGGCLQHCGIMCAADGRFLHCQRGQGVTFVNLNDSTFACRLERIWRPIVI